MQGKKKKSNKKENTGEIFGLTIILLGFMIEQGDGGIHQSVNVKKREKYG